MMDPVLTRFMAVDGGTLRAAKVSVTYIKLMAGRISPPLCFSCVYDIQRPPPLPAGASPTPDSPLLLTEPADRCTLKTCLESPSL